MEALFLGTGNAFASGGRNAMAVLLWANGFGVLLDCGPTTLVALKKEGLTPRDVDLILLSHHHGDHFGGVPFLMLHERYEGPRQKKLVVLGPEGTEMTIATAARLFFPGMDPLPFPFECRDLFPEREETIGEARVRPFEVEHYARGTAFGYRVSLGGKVVVFSGDTEWTEALVPAAEGADLLICECSSFDTKLDQHMTHRDLERNRDRLRAHRTVLVHAGEDVIARESELTFPLAHDGMRMTL